MKPRERQLLTVIVSALAVIAFVMVRDGGGPLTALAPGAGLAVLEARVRGVSRLDNVQQRAHVGDFYRLADAYLGAGRKTEALETLLRALSLDPGNVDRQIQAGRLEMETGALDAAHGRFASVLAGPTTDFQRAHVEYQQTLLQRKGHVPPAAKLPVKTDHVLAFAVFEGADRWVVEALAERVGAAFGLGTRVLPGTIAPDRQRAREGNWSPIPGEQLDAEVLLAQLARGVGQSADAHSVGVVGVAAHDLYADNLNFLFGTARDGAGVMSLARFAHGGVPRESVLARATKQAFSTTGFVLGVPRCSSATCARAYPHSLAELERKGHTLCADCMRGVDRALARAR